MHRWFLKLKPPPDVCPEGFCFHYARAGDQVDLSGRQYDSLPEALAAARTIMEVDGCVCCFGRCSRDPRGGGPKDQYEPNEPALERAGLPWFYFIPGEENLAEEMREEYRRESTMLWGDQADRG